MPSMGPAPLLRWAAWSTLDSRFCCISPEVACSHWKAFTRLAAFTVSWMMASTQAARPWLPPISQNTSATMNAGDTTWE